MIDTNRLSTMRSTAVVIGLVGIIATHVMDLPGKMTEVPYLGVGYIGVIVAAGLIIERIITKADRTAFLASPGLAVAVMAGYVVNRTVGMPGAMDDIGNWFEPIGLLSLVAEGFVIWQALAATRVDTVVGRSADRAPVPVRA